MSWENDGQTSHVFFVDILQGFDEDEEEQSVSDVEVSDDESDDSLTSYDGNILESSDDEESQENPDKEPAPSPPVTSTTQEPDGISQRANEYEVNVIFDDFGGMSIEIEKEFVPTRTVETQTPIAGPEADLFAKKFLKKMQSKK